jgi:hypothetical protein
MEERAACSGHAQKLTEHRIGGVFACFFAWTGLRPALG